MQALLGQEIGQHCFPDGSQFDQMTLQEQLPAIACAVRAGDMPARELAALLLAAAGVSRSTLSALGPEDRRGMPSLKEELLDGSASLDKLAESMGPQGMLSQLAVAVHTSRLHLDPAVAGDDSAGDAAATAAAAGDGDADAAASASDGAEGGGSSAAAAKGSASGESIDSEDLAVDRWFAPDTPQ